MSAHMQILLKQLSSYDVNLVNKLGKIEAFQIASETITYVQGFGYASTEQVTEMSEKRPPADICSERIYQQRRTHTRGSRIV